MYLSSFIVYLSSRLHFLSVYWARHYNLCRSLGEHCLESLFITSRRQVIYKLSSCCLNIPSGLLHWWTHGKCNLALLKYIYNKNQLHFNFLGFWLIQSVGVYQLFQKSWRSFASSRSSFLTFFCCFFLLVNST